MQKIAKQWLQQLGVYEPGRPVEELARELGLPDASSIVKLASNENPLGPSPKAMARGGGGRPHALLPGWQRVLSAPGAGA